jgi:hypothetical protein
MPFFYFFICLKVCLFVCSEVEIISIFTSIKQLNCIWQHCLVGWRAQASRSRSNLCLYFSSCHVVTGTEREKQYGLCCLCCRWNRLLFRRLMFFLWRQQKFDLEIFGSVPRRSEEKKFTRFDLVTFCNRARPTWIYLPSHAAGFPEEFAPEFGLIYDVLFDNIPKRLSNNTLKSCV